MTSLRKLAEEMRRRLSKPGAAEVKPGEPIKNEPLLRGLRGTLSDTTPEQQLKHLKLEHLRREAAEAERMLRETAEEASASCIEQIRLKQQHQQMLYQQAEDLRRIRVALEQQATVGASGGRARLTGVEASNVIGINRSTLSQWHSCTPAWAAGDERLFKHLLERNDERYGRDGIDRLARWYAASRASGGQTPVPCP